VRFLRAFLLGIIFSAFAVSATAQLTIGTVDPGPYTPGSSIAATFIIDPNTCITQGNVFQLRLSDATGNFSPGVIIGSFNSFYTTFVNGTIPLGTLPGTGYRLRVESLTPVLVTAASTAFEIKIGIPVQAKLTSSSQLTNPNPEVFGVCDGTNNNQFFLTNSSTATSTVTANIKNELDGSTSTLNFTTVNQSFTAQLAHYTVFTKAVMPDLTVATKAYQVINNVVNTAFGTSGNNIVCLPLGFLEFNVTIDGIAGIRQNFPGNIYTVNWGDGSSSSHTICDIIQNGEKVKHSYSQSSCGRTATGGVMNAYDVIIRTSNAYCGNIGTAVSSTAKVVVKPINTFTSPPIACTNTVVSFTNTSTLGENPNTSSLGCQPNNVLYNWFVDNVAIEVGKPRSFIFQYTFTTNGIHKVKLTASQPLTCPADPIEVDICIQNPPKPSFTLPTSTICTGTSITPINTSVIDNICNNISNYSWSVSPSTGFTYGGGTTSTSQQPQFVFNTAGIYQVILTISNTSCGAVSTLPQTVVVNASPTATLSPNAALCNINTYDFNPTTPGPTRTSFTGTSLALPGTYTWTITGGNYAFTGGTNQNTQYPSIQFLDFTTYNISVTHANNCGSITANQTISFTPAPIVNAGPDQNICFNDPSFTLSGTITGATTNQAWIGGLGTFTPNRNDLNATYTPTAAEKIAGTVTLRLRVTTTLAAPCNQIDDDIILKIKPNISLTSAAAKTICTGNNVAYTPTSAVAGVTYTWTASGTPPATGYTTNGSGPINDILTNTDLNADATVTYIITPHFDGCDGTPFNLVVTIKPNPIVTPTAANATICNATSSAITLTTNLTGVNYTYTSVITGAITGNSNRALAGTQINDILTNSGTTAGTVTYTITPVSTNGCPGTPASITITVLPSATLPNAGPDEAICNASTYTLKGNTPMVGTGKWTIVTAPTAITFADDTKGNTTISGLQTGNAYTFRWTISDTNCSTSSDDVQITVNPLSVGGTTAGDVNVCAGANNGNINLTGQVGNIIRWERSIDNGVNWSTVTSTTNPYVFSNLTISTQYRAIVQSGSCAEAVSTSTTITVNPGTVAANAGADQNLCSGNGITLNGNNPSPNSGVWTLTSAQAGITITDPTLYNTTATGLAPGQTYTFRWTISGFNGCPPSVDDVTVTYYSPVTNNISASSAPVCAGQSITITGDTPTGGTGTFAYQWQSSTDGNTWSNIPSAINKDLSLIVSSSTYFRRLVNSTICTSISNSLQIIVLPGLTNNTISADQNICIGTVPATLTGTTPSGGSGTYLYQWQSSLNGTAWSDVLGANSVSFTPPTPTVSIYYRRSVASGPCSNNLSNQIKITVNPHAKAELVFNTDKSCSPFVLTATNISATPYTDRNNTYTWFANGVQIGTGITFPGYTLATDNESVIIKLAVTSSLGCNSDETSHTFSTIQNVTAAYTQNATSGCGPLNVVFTNTSNSLTAATFNWDFGNGTTSNLAQPAAVTYQPDPTGKDLTYTVTLKATTPCGTTTQTSTVLVKAKPVSVFSPDKTTGCSPLPVTFSNTSPGNYTSYTYDFGDGSAPLTVTDKNSVSHTYTTLAVRDYIVKMTATNECGSNESQYSIRVSPNDITPELVVNSNQLKGCAPLKVDFFNNTKGASTFVYDFGDGSTKVTHTAPETISHTFTQPGKYTITLYASNNCSNASTIETVEVLQQPSVSFTSDKTSGCDGVTVKFKNTSTGAIGYVWDFGDGSPISNAIEPTHTFNGPGKNYTVTLTATNALGCTNSTTIADFIHVVAPPIATFTVSPGNEVSIPNYSFAFKDISTDAVSWEWTFGDGSGSTLQNPNHTYANEGTYNVTLKVLNKEGCSSSTFQSVRIIGVPGYLNIPNSFIPASAKNEIKIFKAKGRGIKEWQMSVFNKWGQLLWETTKLDDNAPLEGWDGTYKGQEQPQGVYYWKVDIKFINGSNWKGMTYDSSPPKKTGVIYLIR
jgi:PKD repeat protein